MKEERASLWMEEFFFFFFSHAFWQVFLHILQKKERGLLGEFFVYL